MTRKENNKIRIAYRDLLALSRRKRDRTLNQLLKEVI